VQGLVQWKILARLLRLRLDGANLSWNGTEHLVFVWWFSEHEVVQATVIESEKCCSHVGAGSKCLLAPSQMRPLGLVMVF